MKQSKHACSSIKPDSRWISSYRPVPWALVKTLQKPQRRIHPDIVKSRMSYNHPHMMTKTTKTNVIQDTAETDEVAPLLHRWIQTNVQVTSNFASIEESKYHCDTKARVESETFEPEDASLLRHHAIMEMLLRRGEKPTGFVQEDRSRAQIIFNFEHARAMQKMHERQRRIEQQRNVIQNVDSKQKVLDDLMKEEVSELANNLTTARQIDILIRNNPAIRSMRIGISSIGTRALAKSLWKNISLVSLDLTGNNIGDHAGQYIFRALQNNRALVKLEMDRTQLGPQVCREAAKSLRTNTSLKFLSLEGNLLISKTGDIFSADQSTVGISGASQSNEEIRLDKCGIEPSANIATQSKNNNAPRLDTSGFESLACMLRENKGLTSLNLWDTGIDKECGRILARELEDNMAMRTVELGFNEIDTRELQTISRFLKRNADLNMEKIRVHAEKARQQKIVVVEQLTDCLKDSMELEADSKNKMARVEARLKEAEKERLCLRFEALEKQLKQRLGTKQVNKKSSSVTRKRRSKKKILNDGR